MRWLAKQRLILIWYRDAISSPYNNLKMSTTHADDYSPVSAADAKVPAQEDEFTVVSRKKKNRKNRKTFVVREKTLEDHIQGLEQFRLQLEKSKVLKAITKALDIYYKDPTIPTEKETKPESNRKSPANEADRKTTTKDHPVHIPLAFSPSSYASCPKLTSIRCLALGSPTTSSIALYQLALLQLIQTHLGIPDTEISMWDPVFTNMDMEVFGALGYKTEENYDNSTKDWTKSTLVYMIHSPPSLTESIISTVAPLPSTSVATAADSDIQSASSPASTQSSPYTVFIGNHLPNYSLHHLAADLAAKYPTISRALSPKEDGPRWQMVEIEDSESKGEEWGWAVNDLSVYWRV